VRCALSYGGQPIGEAVGPAVEAREALAALEGKYVPNSLIEKSTELAGMILEQGGAPQGKGKEEAKDILKDGRALEKMKEIIEYQGGDPSITSDQVDIGKYSHEIRSVEDGYIGEVNNHGIIGIVRAAGAPYHKCGGLILNNKRGDKVERDEVLFTIYSENKNRLKEAVKLAKHLNPLSIEGMILEKHPDYKTV